MHRYHTITWETRSPYVGHNIRVSAAARVPYSVSIPGIATGSAAGVTLPDGGNSLVRVQYYSIILYHTLFLSQPQVALGFSSRQDTGLAG